MAVLPSDILYGQVIAAYVLAVGNQEGDRKPDAVYPKGTISFTPVSTRIVSTTTTPVISVSPQKVIGTLVDGRLMDDLGNDSVTLVVGQYNVSFDVERTSIPGFPITVTSAGTVDLGMAQPLIPAPNEKFVVNELVYTQTLAARDEVLAAIAAGTVPARISALSKKINSADLNTIVDNGWYSGSQITNAPSTGFFYVQVQQWDSLPSGSFLMQTAVAAGQASNSGTTYRRFREGDTNGWTPWRITGDALGASDSLLRSLLDPVQRLSNVVRALAANTDLNTVTDSGWARGTGMVNGPFPFATNAWCFYEVRRDDSNNYVTQVASCYYDNGTGLYVGKTWKRNRNAGTWTGWVQTEDLGGAIDPTARGLGNGAVPLSAAVALRVFAKDAAGAPVGVTYGTGTDAGMLVQRNADGRIDVPGPASSAHAVPKSYADDRAGDKTPTDNAAATTTFTIDGTQSKTARRVLGGNVTASISGVPTAGLAFSVSLILVQDATGGRTVTWPAAIKWAGGVKPVLSTAPNAIDVVTVLWNGTEWLGFLGGVAFA